MFNIGPNSIISASGSSSIRVHSTSTPDFPLIEGEGVKAFSRAHKLGCHHLTTSEDGRVMVSAGFGGEIKIWRCQASESESDEAAYGTWQEVGILPSTADDTGVKSTKTAKAGEVWAISLDAGGEKLATSSYDGRVVIWDLKEGLETMGKAGQASWRIWREYETKGSFGTSVAMV
jgi:superkiller protein 8